MMELRRKGLSGAVSAMLITLVLVAGIASASYVNMTAVRHNEAAMQEALRQARLGSELIRIHIHSTDGSVDSPPRITFVNAWGFESRVKQLVIIARNMSVLATVDLRQPLVLPPGSRLTIEPSQFGVGYRTFRELADNIRSIHAYTEAGNSFGSTWGFPREDNMAGRTVAVTYNATTTEVWNVPSFTWINRTVTRTGYITVGPIPPVESATITAVNLFERTVLRFGRTMGSVSSSSWSSSGHPASPSVPIPSGDFNPVDVGVDRYLGCWSGRLDNCDTYGNPYDWYWHPMGLASRGQGIQEFASVTGQTIIVEGGTYHTLIHGPLFYRQSFTVGSAQVTVRYRLTEVEITPTPEGFPQAIDRFTRKGNVFRPVASRWTYIATQTIPDFDYTWYIHHTYTIPRSTATGPTITAFNSFRGLLFPRTTNFDLELRLDPRFHHSGYGYLLHYTVAPACIHSCGSGYDYTIPTTIIVPNYRGYFIRDWNIISSNRAIHPIAMYLPFHPGNYTVYRYYVVDSFQVDTYVPPPIIQLPTGNPIPEATGTPPRPEPTPVCDVISVNPESDGSNTGGSTGGGGVGSTPGQNYVIRVFVRLC